MFGPAQLAKMGAEESGEKNRQIILVWGKKHDWIMDLTRKGSLGHLHWSSQGVKSSVIVDYGHV